MRVVHLIYIYKKNSIEMVSESIYNPKIGAVLLLGELVMKLSLLLWFKKFSRTGMCCL